MNGPGTQVVHLGLGAFHRAHQAWYTQHAEDGSRITAFTGRSPHAAAALAAQGFRYTLLERGPAGDRSEVISSIGAAYDGSNATEWRSAMQRSGVLTLTVTEAAYRLDHDIRAQEILRLRKGNLPQTPVGRIVDGLMARRTYSRDGMAIVSCDNLNKNGAVLRAAVIQLASELDRGLADWVADRISFVSTMVDRITPAIAAADIGAKIDGEPDVCAVATEPYSAWILSGDFPAGRPTWERAGARFVDDIEPFERRKLWLLNAGHSLLALRGLVAGWHTVAEAVRDPNILVDLNLLWDDAAAVLPFSVSEISQERTNLLDRFRNPRIVHQLDQIARDTEFKLRERVGAVISERIARGLDTGGGELAAVAAWITAVQHGHVSGSAPSAPRDAAAWAATRLVPDGVIGESDLARLGSLVEHRAMLR